MIVFEQNDREREKNTTQTVDLQKSIKCGLGNSQMWPGHTAAGLRDQIPLKYMDFIFQCVIFCRFHIFMQSLSRKTHFYNQLVIHYRQNQYIAQFKYLVFHPNGRIFILCIPYHETSAHERSVRFGLDKEGNGGDKTEKRNTDENEKKTDTFSDMMKTKLKS